MQAKYTIDATEELISCFQICQRSYLNIFSSFFEQFLNRVLSHKEDSTKAVSPTRSRSCSLL